MASETSSRCAHTWKTFLAFFLLGAVLFAMLAAILQLWFDGRVASMAAAFATVPIAISGNRSWGRPRVWPWIVLVLIAMGIVGGFLGTIIGV